MKTVMVVDDEAPIRELLGAVLGSAGFTVIAAVDGKDCLRKLESMKPDLILLDMMMPGMSGREVCQGIRKNQKTKSLKVIFVTVAKFSETGKDTLKELKVLDYITKPFDNDDLIKRVKKAI
ncbi:MAG TPA: response regulator [archaeon]|nr:response regulator [archaeon]